MREAWTSQGVSEAGNVAPHAPPRSEYPGGEKEEAGMKRPKTLKKFTQGRGYSKEDWDAVSDNPEWTDVAKAQSFKDVFPDLYAVITRASNDGKCLKR